MAPDPPPGLRAARREDARAPAAVVDLPAAGSSKVSLITQRARSRRARSWLSSHSQRRRLGGGRHAHRGSVCSATRGGRVVTTETRGIAAMLLSAMYAVVGPARLAPVHVQPPLRRAGRRRATSGVAGSVLRPAWGAVPPASLRLPHHRSCAPRCAAPRGLRADTRALALQAHPPHPGAPPPTHPSRRQPLSSRLVHVRFRRPQPTSARLHPHRQRPAAVLPEPTPILPHVAV